MGVPVTHADGVRGMLSTGARAAHLREATVQLVACARGCGVERVVLRPQCTRSRLKLIEFRGDGRGIHRGQRGFLHRIHQQRIGANASPQSPNRLWTECAASAKASPPPPPPSVTALSRIATKATWVCWLVFPDKRACARMVGGLSAPRVGTKGAGRTITCWGGGGGVVPSVQNGREAGVWHWRCHSTNGVPASQETPLNGRSLPPIPDCRPLVAALPWPPRHCGWPPKGTSHASLEPRRRCPAETATGPDPLGTATQRWMGYSGTAPTTRANGIAKPPPIATWAQRHSGGVCRGEAPSCRIGAVVKQKRANGLQFWGRRARGMAVECAVACTRARREHAPAVAFSAAPSSAAFVSPARHGGGGCGCASSCAMCSCTSCSAVRRSDVDQPPGLCLPAVRHSAGRPCAGPSGDVHSLETETETGQVTYARRRICRHTRCGVPDPDRVVPRSGHDVVPVGRDGDRPDPV